MSTPDTEPRSAPVSSSIRIHGGAGAPERARRYVRSQLVDGVCSDAALIVSELVTNSVLHAGVGAHESLFVELTPVGDQLRIAVIDSGSSREPHLVAADPGTPGGFGLRLVDQMCSAWGVLHDPEGTTCVWCDVPLDRTPAV